MTNTPPLIDRTSLVRNRTRGEPPNGYFLHQEAIADLQDRLQMITKPFTDVAIVTGHPEYGQKHSQTLISTAMMIPWISNWTAMIWWFMRWHYTGQMTLWGK